MTGMQALGQPFIYDRGTQTVHMAPVGSYHGDMLRRLGDQFQGPIFQGEHDGGVIGWHTTPSADERQAVVKLLTRNYGHPFHDKNEYGKDEMGEFELPHAGEPGEGPPARSFGSKVLDRVRGWLSPQPAVCGASHSSLGGSGQPGAAPQTIKCATCGDPLPPGSADCPRCNWGGWNKADDALHNPIDPTIDMHRGIQAKNEPPAMRNLTGGSRSELSSSRTTGFQPLVGHDRSTSGDKYSADEFDSQPFWMRREEWQPGVEGKGWLGENGVHSWRIGSDRYPRHMDMRNNAQQAVGNLLRAFHIGPDGKVYDIGRDPVADQHMQQILAADPRLHNEDSEPFTLSKQASPLILGPSENAKFPEWQPGQRGKGYVNDQGAAAWGVDQRGMPFHEQYARQDPTWAGARQFYIEPSGEVHDFNTNKLSEQDYNSILGQNPAFFRPGPKDEQEFNISKRAMAVPLYHVAPASARENIREKGLIGNQLGETSSPWTRDFGQPPGNYFWDDPYAARQYVYPLHDQIDPPAQRSRTGDVHYPGDDPDEFYNYGVTPNGTVIEPETEEGYEDEINERPYNHETDRHLLPPKLQGYDIWQVPEHALQNVRRDPENRLLSEQSQYHERPEDWSENEMLTPEEALNATRRIQEEHGDPSYYGQTPLRYYTDERVPPEMLQLHEHIPAYAMTTDNMYDSLDNAPQEYPEPYHHVEIQDWPSYKPPSHGEWEPSEGEQTFSRVIPPDRWWTPVRRPSEG